MDSAFGLRSEVELSCQLIPANNTHPPIELRNGRRLIIGRGPLTGINDKKCSRAQVKVVPDFGKQEVTLQPLGPYPIQVCSSPVRKGEVFVLGAGGSFEMLPGKYKFHIHFAQSLSKQARAALEISGVDACGSADDSDSIFSLSGDDHTSYDDDDDKNVCANTSDAIVAKLQGPSDPRVEDSRRVESRREESQLHQAPGHTITVQQKKKKQVCTGTGPQHKRQQTTIDTLYGLQGHKKNVYKAHWNEVETLMMLEYGPQTASERIAAFDLDNTLIKTASGRKFSKDSDDWVLCKNVSSKLQQLHKDKAKIVIFSNQAGIAGKPPAKASFKLKVESVAGVLGVPFTLFVALGHDIYRKPATGMWRYMVTNCCSGLEPNISTSFYVGDAAGREANWMQGANKDFSCGDRKFASNLAMNFLTPEEFFLGEPPCTKFSWGDFNPLALSYSRIPSLKLDPSDAQVCATCQEVVVLVGCPASGKTSFAKTHLPSYHYINRDMLGSWQKCVAECQTALRAGRSVVIDNTNPDAESRCRYIQSARERGVRARCFHITTTIAHAKHNNRFRELARNGGDHAKVGEMAFLRYKSKFLEPQLSEGFVEVVKVEFIPHFSDSSLESLYRSYLLD